LEELWTALFSIFGVASVSFTALFFMFWVFYIIAAFLIGITLFVFWIIALVDCIRRDEKDFALGGENAKLIWILLLIFIRGVAGLVYYIIIMRNKPVKKIKTKKK
jgi:hypothetical protein